MESNCLTWLYGRGTVMRHDHPIHHVMHVLLFTRLLKPNPHLAHVFGTLLSDGDNSPHYFGWCLVSWFMHFGWNVVYALRKSTFRFECVTFAAFCLRKRITASRQRCKRLYRDTSVLGQMI